MLLAFDLVNLLLDSDKYLHMSIHHCAINNNKNWKLPKCLNLKREEELFILKIEWYVAIKNQVFKYI